MIQCPACPAMLQRLEPPGHNAQGIPNHAQQALDLCDDLSIGVPVHGPAGLLWLALVSHARTVHHDLDLVQLLHKASLKG